MFEIVGGVFTALTVSVKVSLAVSVPSLTVTVTVVVPLWPAAGVAVTVRLEPLPPKTMLAFGRRVVLEEEPLTVRLAAAVSASPTVKLSGPAAPFWLMTWLVMSEMVGGWGWLTSIMLPMGTSSTSRRSKMTFGPAPVGPKYMRWVAAPLPVVMLAAGEAGLVPLVARNTFIVPLAPVPLVHSTQT